MSRIRTLLGLVVVVACTIWGTIRFSEGRQEAARRSSANLRLARAHGEAAGVAEIFGGGRNMALAQYHKELERKYLHASERPWEPVPPDPPEP